MKTQDNKLTIFKGIKTEAKFNNGMSIELWYDKNHSVSEARPIMYNLVRCWNMHDEVLNQLKIQQKFMDYLRGIFKEMPLYKTGNIRTELETKSEILNDLIEKYTLS